MMDNEKLELKDGSICLLQDIKKDLQEVYDHYRSVIARNEYLESEIKRIKSEHYKDEELSKMKEKCDKMSKDYYRGFPISEEEMSKISEWINSVTKDDDFNTKTGGPIGGRFIYEFISTSIGSAGRVVDSKTGKKFTFREL